MRTAWQQFLRTSYGRRTLRQFNDIKSEIENPAAAIMQQMQKQKRIHRVLDIGGGTGERIMAILNGTGAMNARVDFIEPSKEAAADFMRYARLSGVNATSYTIPFEAFRTTARYDAIIAVHSWYYIDLVSLKKLYRLLAPDGCAYIYVGFEADTIQRLQYLCEAPFGCSHANGNDICAALDRYRIAYHVQHEGRNLTGLLDRHGKLTPRARTIIALLSCRRWSDVPSVTKKAALAALRAIGDGTDTYPSRRGLIVVQKNKNTF